MPSESLASRRHQAGHTRKGKALNKIRNTRNLKRTVSALMVSIGLTLVTTAAPVLAGGTWAG